MCDKKAKMQIKLSRIYAEIAYVEKKAENAVQLKKCIKYATAYATA